MNPQQRLGATIKAQRKAKGYSQEGFAERCDIRQTYMVKIEKGTANPSTELLVRIAKKLEISVAELMEKAGV